MKREGMSPIISYLHSTCILTGGDQVGLQLDDILEAAEFQPQKYECGPNTSPSGVTRLLCQTVICFSNCLWFRASYLFARNSSICSRQVVQWPENELRATQQQSFSIRGVAKRCHHWSPLCMVGSWPSYLLHLLWLFAIAGYIKSWQMQIARQVKYFLFSHVAP